MLPPNQYSCHNSTTVRHLSSWVSGIVRIHFESIASLTVTVALFSAGPNGIPGPVGSEVLVGSRVVPPGVQSSLPDLHCSLRQLLQVSAMHVVFRRRFFFLSVLVNAGSGGGVVNEEVK